MRLIAQPARGKATRLEIPSLHAGTNFSIVVRARTESGWGPASEALYARTMRPADFPAPLRAPSVARLEGCVRA